MTQSTVIRTLRQQHKVIYCTHCNKTIGEYSDIKGFSCDEPIEYIQPITGKPKVFYKDCFKEYLTKGC